MKINGHKHLFTHGGGEQWGLKIWYFQRGKHNMQRRGITMSLLSHHALLQRCPAQSHEQLWSISPAQRMSDTIVFAGSSCSQLPSPWKEKAHRLPGWGACAPCCMDYLHPAQGQHEERLHRHTHTPPRPISLAAYKWSFLLETDFCLRWCQFFMFQGDWERCRQEEQADNRFIGWPHRVAAPSFRQANGGEGWLWGCHCTLSLHRNCYSTKSNTKLSVDIKR